MTFQVDDSVGTGTLALDLHLAVNGTLLPTPVTPRLASVVATLHGLVAHLPAPDRLERRVKRGALSFVAH